MAYRRIVVPLQQKSVTFFFQIAELESRDPREQMRFLLPKEAHERGLMGHADAIGTAVP